MATPGSHKASYKFISLIDDEYSDTLYTKCDLFVLNIDSLDFICTTE